MEEAETKGLGKSLKAWAARIRSEIWVLYHASKDPRTPWYVKMGMVLVIAYAISPIDLIPDFIPVIGYLDDLILVPLGIWCCLKMIPPAVVESCRMQVEHSIRDDDKRFYGMAGAGLVVFAWIFCAGLLLGVLRVLQ